MNRINTLKMSLFDKWFALENHDMNPVLYAKLVNSLEKVFEHEYGVTGAKEHVNKVQKNNRLVLFINQKKAPNIAKVLVNHPKVPIRIVMRGKNSAGQDESLVMEKPWDARMCTSLIPYYNGLNNKTPKTPQQPNKR